MPHLAIHLGKSVRLKSLGASTPRIDALNAPNYPGDLLHRICLARHQISPAPPVRSASMQTRRTCYQESV